MTNNCVSNTAGKTLLLSMEWFPQRAGGWEIGRKGAAPALGHPCVGVNWHKTWAHVSIQNLSALLPK